MFEFKGIVHILSLTHTDTRTSLILNRPRCRRRWTAVSSLLINTTRLQETNRQNSHWSLFIVRQTVQDSGVHSFDWPLTGIVHISETCGLENIVSNFGSDEQLTGGIPRFGANFYVSREFEFNFTHSQHKNEMILTPPAACSDTSHFSVQKKKKTNKEGKKIPLEKSQRERSFGALTSSTSLSSATMASGADRPAPADTVVPTGEASLT